jgi:hypothetical protein
MFIRVCRGKSKQTFSKWGHDEAGLTIGEGMFVGTEGVRCNHHFILPPDGTPYAFLAGDYQIDVFATVVNGRAPIHLAG